MVALPQRLDIRDDESRPGAKIIYINNHRVAAFGATGNDDLALAYHQRGVRVFPCREDRFGPSEEHPKGDPEAKKPYPGIMWQGPEPSRRASIERWWRDWPDALIGVGLGERNLLVIDVDSGAAGVAAWEAYCAARGISLDGVPYVDTPTGGRHYFFRLPAGVTHGNGRGGLPKKAELPVDVRGGKSGYVIAAGTDRAFRGLYRPDSGDTFAWLDAGLVPNQLLEVLQGKREHDDAPAAPAPSLPAIVTTPADHGHYRVQGWIEAAFRDEIEGVASCPSGGRNEQLNKAAFALGQFVAAGFLPEDQVRGALESAAAASGLWRDDGAAQCRKTISSGLNSGMREPRPIPPDILEDIEADRMGAEIRRTLVVQPDGSMMDPETGEITDPESPAGLLDRFIWHGEAVPEPPPALIKRTLPRDGVVLLGGQSGAGKTFLVANLAVSLATGADFFGRRVKETVGSVILAAEGAATLPLRLAVAAEAVVQGEKLPIVHKAISTDLMNPVNVTRVINELRAVRAEMLSCLNVRLGVIFLDTVAASFGFDDENSNSEVTKATNAMRRIATAVDALVIGVHHFGKDASTGFRGGSAWRGNVDGALAVTADRDQSTGYVGNRALNLVKTRVGEEGPIAPFSLKFVKTGVDEDGEDEGACIVVPDLTTSPVMTARVPAAALPPQPKRAAGQRPEAFRRAFNEALLSHGETRAIQGDGPSVRTVPLTKVREAFWRFYVTGGEPDPEKQENARRAAWSAMQKSLIGTEFYAGKWGDEEWIWAKH